MDWLLLKGHKKKLDILELLERSGMTLEAIANRNNITIHCANEYIRAINSEMARGYNKKIIEKRLNNMYSVNITSDTLYSQLKQLYLESMPAYSILISIAIKGQILIKSFCEENNMTIVKFEKIINEINENLDKYKLRLTIMQDKLMMTGKEVRILLFQYELMEELIKINRWPFEHFSKEEIIDKLREKSFDQHVDRLSESKITRVCFIIALTKVRLCEEHYLFNIKGKDIEFMKLFLLDEGISKALSEDYSSVNIEDKKEILLCNLLVRALIPGFAIRKNRLDLGRRFLSDSYCSARFGRELTKALNVTMKLNLTKQQTEELNFYIAFIHFYEKIKGIGMEEIPHFLTHDTIKDNYYNENNVKTIGILLYQVAKSEQQEFLTEPEVIKYNSILLCKLLQRFFNERVSINIQMNQNIISKYKILERLEKIFTNDTIAFSSNIESADIVVTENPCLPLYEKQQVVEMNVLHSLYGWSNLLNKIWKLSREKKKRYEHN